MSLHLCSSCVAGQHEHCRLTFPDSYACVCDVNRHFGRADRAVMTGLVLGGQEALDEYIAMCDEEDDPEPVPVGWTPGPDEAPY